MPLKEKQLERIAQIRERQELTVDFSSALDRLRNNHYDLDPVTFNRWEGYLVDHDELALGAVIAVMDAREARGAKAAQTVNYMGQVSA